MIVEIYLSIALYIITIFLSCVLMYFITFYILLSR